MYAAIVQYLNLIYWQQVICFKSLNLEQVISKYSERLYLCLKNYHCNLNLKFNYLFHSLSVIECTPGRQYISVTLYLSQTYPSGKPLFKDQGHVNLTFVQMQANNKYMKYYDKSKESLYFKFWDVKSLYRWAMLRKLSLDGFKRVQKTS